MIRREAAHDLIQREARAYAERDDVPEDVAEHVVILGEVLADAVSRMPPERSRFTVLDAMPSFELSAIASKLLRPNEVPILPKNRESLIAWVLRRETDTEGRAQ